MSQRLPLTLAAIALIVALFGSTPLTGAAPRPNGIAAGEIAAGKGLKNYEQVSGAATLDATDDKSAIASCSDGKQVVGGGAVITGAGQDFAALDNLRPIAAGTKWEASAHEHTSTSLAWNITAYAFCAKTS